MCPDISEYYTSGADTIKAGDIDDELTLTIKSYRSHQFDGSDRPTLFLSFEEDDREWRCNVTNMERIAEMYGPKIEKWIGEQITIKPDKIRKGKYKGGDTTTVRIRETKRNAPKKFDDRNPPPPMDDEVPF